MNRRISCSLALLVLLCAGLQNANAFAQEVLPQQVAGEGAALSVVQWVKPRTAGVLKGDILAPVLGWCMLWLLMTRSVVLRGKNGWVGEGDD